ncbi:MAG: hypothetical protein ACJA10_001028 [Oleispira sp.]|jgi:hypothetical protein
MIKMRKFKFGAVLLGMVFMSVNLSANTLTAAHKHVDFEYNITKNKETIGYGRLTSQPRDLKVGLKDTEAGEQISEISEFKLSGFFADTDIRTRTIEHFDANNKLVLGIYTMLFDKYFVLTQVHNASNGRLKESNHIYELDDVTLSSTRTQWAVLLKRAIKSNEPLKLIPIEIKSLKAIESDVHIIDPNNFDVTQTYLSLHLKDLVHKSGPKVIRVFDPTAENDFIYSVKAELNTKLEEKALHATQSDAQKQDQTINVITLDDKRQSKSESHYLEYLYQFKNNTSHLVKIIDMTGDEKIEMTIR